MDKIKTAIIGPGLIGTDLMYKIINKGKYLKLDTMVGIYQDSKGLQKAKRLGFNTTAKGIMDIIKREDIMIYFDATGAGPHAKINAPAAKKAGKIIIDLTPAALGPYIVPAVNFGDPLAEKNVNLVTCGGQATVPIVFAIDQAVGVDYAEVVASTASPAAGPGTRKNIDEYTRTTKKALEMVGGADRAKAIITLNPTKPPIKMKNTIYTRVKKRNPEAIKRAVDKIVEQVKKYVPGYNLKIEPELDGDIVTTVIEVTGAGDYLPEYAGNLDIMTAAALETGELFAEKILKGEVNYD